MPHFEIHASDVEAAKKFYNGLFGWTFMEMPGGEEEPPATHKPFADLKTLLKEEK